MKNKITIYRNPSGHYIICPFCKKNIQVNLIIDESSHRIDIDGECRICLFNFSASIHSRYIKLYN